MAARVQCNALVTVDILDNTETPLGAPLDLRSQTTSVSITLDREELDSTTMASGCWMEKTAGLRSASMSVEVNMDDAIFNFLTDIFLTHSNKARVTYVRDGDSPVSVTNKRAVFTRSFLPSGNPVNGAVGEIETTTLEFNSDGPIVFEIV